MNQLMLNADRRNAFQLDNVFLQFQEAKKTLLKTAENELVFLDDIEEADDDFDF